MVDQRTIATAFAELQARLEDEVHPVVVCHPDTADTVQQVLHQLPYEFPVPQLETNPNVPPGDVLLFPSVESATL